MATKNVSFTKPETPSFIAKFKEKVGYKESATVETKFEEPGSSTLDDTELADEKPTVVLGSNVSEAEADAFLDRLKEEEASREGADKDYNHEEEGKIIFKKPSKRKSSGSEKDFKSSDNRKKPKPTSTMKEVRNKSLLSFSDEEEEGQ